MVFACKPKDADIQKAITEKIMSTPEMQGMTVSVVDGVATISGQCKDDACKANCESIVKGIKGVKSVVNNCTLPAPVIINPDDTLTTAVNGVLTNFAGVSAAVLDGVVTLTGEIKKDQLTNLIQAVQELQPKKVENKLTIK